METNPRKSYLPMPLTSARRIENERLSYREAQRLHHAAFPDYARGWRRPSDTTAPCVVELVGVDPAVLSVTEHQAIVIVLDAAIQAGEDGRLLGHNLIFDALAAAWSDWYRAAVERGPARVSWEMDGDTLKGAWRDLGRNEIDMAKMLRLAQHGYALYQVKKGRDGRSTVELTGKTEERRRQFLDILKEDAAHGGTYERRSSWPRLRLASEPGESTIETATTRRVVAEFAYNVAVPGERSMAVIRHLEGGRLFLNAKAVENEYSRLGQRHDEIITQALELGVDVTKSTAKTRIKVKDRGTGETRDGFAWSPWRRHMTEVLGKVPKPERLALQRQVTALAKEYDKVEGQAQQLHNIVMRVREIARAGGLDEHGEIEIRTRYAKLSNRRFQARDFWFTEISGKRATEIAELIDLGHYEDDYGNEIEVETDRVASRRGRLFRVAASTSAEERERRVRENEWNYPFVPHNPKMLDSRQDLVGVDVSGSQIQIYAVLLGLRKLEDKLQKDPAKAIFAWRAWHRARDPRDPFELPGEYTGPHDERLQAAMKQAVMEAMYDAKPALIAERLEEEGHCLGTANLSQFLGDHELGLDVIATRWKPAVRQIAARAYKADPFAGITFTDPFDGATVRWNPIKWEVPQDRRVAGTDEVRISAKVPKDATRNAAGELPVWKEKLTSMTGPSFIHMLDAMFCGFVVEELAARGVKDVVAVHDAWYVAADAEGKLRDAIRGASIKWMERLGHVYDELQRLFGTCVPPKRGKNKGRCCGRCANWIKELRAQWRARVDAGDWPDFNVGDASPAREVYR